MAQAYTMNGIIGIRPELSYSLLHERCSASLPGHEGVIAHLPFETTDAVFTNRGLLIHRNMRNELQAISIPDHEKLWRIAGGADQDGTSGSYRVAHSRITDGKMDVGTVQTGTIRGNAVKLSETQEFEQIRMIVQHMMTDIVKKEVIPLTTRIEELRRQNQRLADKIQSLEDQNRQWQVLKSDSGAGTPLPKFTGEAVERQWGEHGGLQTFLNPDANPFRRRR